jgi:hypothetical protein
VSGLWLICNWTACVDWSTEEPCVSQPVCKSSKGMISQAEVDPSAESVTVALWTRIVGPTNEDANEPYVLFSQMHSTSLSLKIELGVSPPVLRYGLWGTSAGLFDVCDCEFALGNVEDDTWYVGSSRDTHSPSHCHVVTYCSVLRSLSCPIHHSLLNPHLFTPPSHILSIPGTTLASLSTSSEVAPPSTGTVGRWVTAEIQAFGTRSTWGGLTAPVSPAARCASTRWTVLPISYWTTLQVGGWVGGSE